MRPLTIAVVAISLLATEAHAQSGWAGALEGFGRAGQEAAAEWQREEQQKELLRQQNEYLMEQDRIRAERERQLMLEQREQDNARQREQQQAIEKIQRERAALEKERVKLEYTRNELIVEQAHPGWQNTMRTAEFDAWTKKQPASIQQIIESKNPTTSDAILVLDLYKRDTAPRVVVQKNVTVKRDPKARAEFMRQQPCPATGKTRGACPGYVVDHIKSITCGGADDPSNMQWQTIADTKANDGVKRKGC